MFAQKLARNDYSAHISAAADKKKKEQGMTQNRDVMVVQQKYPTTSYDIARSNESTVRKQNNATWLVFTPKLPAY